MTIAELITKYGIRDGKTMGKPGAIFVANPEKAQADKAIDEIKSKKPDILAYFENQRNAAETAAAERQAKIDSIDGLKEIQDAMADVSEWRREFNASFEGKNAVGGLGVRACPEYDFDALYAKYPRAHAYLRAKAEANKTNIELSYIGRKALEEVINGDYVKAMAQMEKDLHEFANRHMWD